jgi:hypothetical protein
VKARAAGLALAVPGHGHRFFARYIFAGVEGRAVARNRFLDGNSFELRGDLLS